jgi:hypothetical protein
MADTLERSDIVEQVIAELNQRAMRFKEKKDPREIFTVIYREITEGVLTKLLNPQSNQGFDDPHWLADLDLKFAQYYIKASDAFDRNDPQTPSVWQAVFKAIGAGKPKPHPLSTVIRVWWQVFLEAIGVGKSWDVLQALLLPMVAHIMHDLVLALADSNAGPDNEVDHQQLTDLLCKEIDEVQQTRATFAPLLGQLDKFLGNLDEKFTCHIVRRMRQQAWIDAQALRAAQNDEEKRAVITKSVEDKTLRVINEISASPLKLLDLL